MPILIADPIDVQGHPRIVPYAAVTSVRREGEGIALITLNGELLELRADFERLVEAWATGLAYDARDEVP
jgi:hypothetical protein